MSDSSPVPQVSPPSESPETEAVSVKPADRPESTAMRAKPARSFLGLTRPDQLILAVLAGGALMLMIWHWARLSGWGTRPVEVERLDPRSLEYRIDINTATWVEWVQLDGIGETLAERIIEDRTARGPFRSVDELRRVKGIGPKTLEKIRPHLTIGKPPGQLPASRSIERGRE